MKKHLITVLLLCAATSAALAEKPTPAATQEIEHLISHLKNSGCEFQRNGSWYDSAKAADHLRGKYDYLLKKAGCSRLKTSSLAPPAKAA